jgi:hypothetical protein
MNFELTARRLQLLMSVQEPRNIQDMGGIDAFCQKMQVQPWVGLTEAEELDEFKDRRESYVHRQRCPSSSLFSSSFLCFHFVLIIHVSCWVGVCLVSLVQVEVQPSACCCFYFVCIFFFCEFKTVCV